MIKIECQNLPKGHYWMDGFLKQNLDSAKKIIKDNWDFLWVVDGRVGAGKSVLAQQIGWYVSEGKLRIENICFDPEQFREAILNAPKYDCIIFDEAFRGLSSRSALSKTNKTIVSLLNEIRQKNLFVLVVLPSMWDLDKYVTMHRAKGVFHVMTRKVKDKSDEWVRQRGHAMYYSSEKIHSLIGNSKMRYVYPSKKNFHFTFKKGYTVPEEAYDKKKSDALGQLTYDPGKPAADKYGDVKHRIVHFLREKGYTWQQVSAIIGRGERTVQEWLVARRDKSQGNPVGTGGAAPRRGEEEDESSDLLQSIN